MADSALIRHMIGRVSMDTRKFSEGSQRVRRESENLNQSFKKTFGKGIESLDILGKTLRGGAVFGGLTALSFKVLEVHDNWLKLEKLVTDFPGVVSDSTRSALAVFQSLPMVGKFFDIGEEAKASQAVFDKFSQTAQKLKDTARNVDMMFLSGDSKAAAQFRNQLDSLKETLAELRAAAAQNQDVGLVGTIDAQLKRLASSREFLLNLSKQQPIIDAIKAVTEQATNFGKTEKDIAVARLEALGASKTAIDELAAAYDKLERKTKSAKDKETADALIKESRSRRDVLKDDLQEWYRLYSLEKLPADALSRLIRGRLGKQSESELPSLAIRGTQAAESLISRQSVQRQKTDEEILKEIREMVKTSKNSNELFRKIEQKLGGPANV